MYKHPAKPRKPRPDPPPISEGSVYSARALPGIEREQADDGTKGIPAEQQKPEQPVTTPSKRREYVPI